MEQDAPTTLEEHWDITYNHALGEVASRFYEALRDQEQILGRRCPSCERVLLPPRPFCDRDFVDTTDWVEVGHEGRVEVFTVVFQTFKGLPEAPYCIAYVLLDGADTAILNYVKGIDWTPDNVPQNIKVGDRVRAVFKEEREGRITDFWFEKIQGE
jgi:uncharacterized OB-fold protein